MQLVHLESIDDPQVEAYTNLTELQLRNRLEPSKGIFIAESPKVITRALAAGRQPISLLVEEPWIEGMADIFAFIDEHWGDDIPVYVASPEQLRRITGYRLHRGALAAMHRWELPTVAEVCANATRIAVLVTPSCSDPLYRRAIRVSMGTVFQVPWTRIGGDDVHYWPWQGLEELHGLGFTTAAMALSDDSISLDDLVWRLHANDNTHIDKLALIFGTEGDGLSRHTIANADLTVKIPMSHDVDSLNVAASSAVAFYSTRDLKHAR